MNSNEVRRRWAERSGEYSPDYYAYYGPDETSESVGARIDDAVERDAAVLELGCSSGRHLAHLRERGYDDLHGIEINDEAFEVMAEEYPDLAETGTFYAAAIEDVVGEFADDRFDAVFSVETLQHLHPDDAWVFDELARITESLLVTVENEGESGEGEAASADGDDPAVNYVNDEFPLYYRDWNRVFTERGFAEVHAEAGDRDTLRAFRPERD
ncbi:MULTISPECIES: class I SAM-dependent methyltransferase [Halorussus]|uniref:class I SAM-dependent methyltransferase n=1 Tax=Halorussus TaxID=1070314 RepID=UPI00209F95DA|nr:class I SAM-dependent methyltransferase [Halorussus vallis]USZ74821.1 class I SAM-dependent methyltransferase [Halorussus vallis]